MKKFTQFFKLYNKQLYLGLTGTFWILFFLYIRFIKERQNYLLDNLQMTQHYIYIQIIFMLSHVILISIAFYMILTYGKNRNRHFWILNKINNFIEIVFTKPLIYVRDTISPHIPGSGNFYIKIMDFFLKNDRTRYFKNVVIILYALPRIVVALVFFIELVFYHQIYYFIHSLIILIIPLFWVIFVNLFTDFGKKWAEGVLERTIIEPLGNELPNGLHDGGYIMKKRPEYNYNEEELQEGMEIWKISIQIFTFGANYLKAYQLLIAPYITIFCSSCYLMGILYKLCYFLF